MKILFKVRNVIPKNSENIDILDRLQDAENIISSRIDEHELLQKQKQKQSNLKSASISHIHLPPTSFSVCNGDYAYTSIEKICEIFGLR